MTISFGINKAETLSIFISFSFHIRQKYATFAPYMEQISPIQALLQQRTLLQLEYYTEKEAFRKLTEQMGMQRKVKRGDAWFPLQVGKSFYNSLNQTAIEVFRTSDQDIEHNFEFGRPVMFFMVKKMGKNENQGNTALQQPENPSDANHKVQSSNIKVQSQSKWIKDANQPSGSLVPTSLWRR